MQCHEPPTSPGTWRPLLSLLLAAGLSACAVGEAEAPISEEAEAAPASTAEQASPLTQCITNGNFQGGSTGWTASGTAFNGWPHSTCGWNNLDCFDGKGINSHFNGEEATGTLTSATFTIQQRYVCWQSAGTSSSHTGIDVGANGTIDVTVGNAEGGTTFVEQCADLGAYLGQQARVVLVDNDSAGSHAWAGWDNFLCRDAAPTCVLNGQFQDGALHWSSQGTAFNGWPHTSCPDMADGCLDGSAVNTANNTSYATGKLFSNTFTVTDRYVCWQAGGFPGSTTGVDLDANGSVDLAVGVPSDNNTWWREQCVDLQAYKGRLARLVLSDDNTAGVHGWAAWDRFSCRNEVAACVPNGDFQAGATGWSAASTSTGFNGWPHAGCGGSGACKDGKGVSTYNNGEQALGTLRSGTFRISDRYVCWEAGGYPSAITRIDVDVDGDTDVWMNAPGVDGNSASGDRWVRQCADLKDYMGRLAQVVLQDHDNTSTFAWGSWDNFTCGSSESPPAPSCVPNGHFEGGMAGWTATGTAFQGLPASSCANSGPCMGSLGVSTLLNGEQAAGTLTSSTFTLRTPYLCWRAGGYGASHTGIDVDANGSLDVVVAAPGTDGNTGGDTWVEQCANVSAYVGRQARVVLVDNDTGGTFAWGAWDHFSCKHSDTSSAGTAAATCVPNGNLQQGEESWVRAGPAFTGWPHSLCNYLGDCYDGQGLFTWPAGEPATGKLYSEVFTIKRRHLCWQGSGYGPSYTGLDVDLDGDLDVTVGAPHANALVEQCMDLQHYQNRKARLVLVDSNDGASHAWVGWDNFQCRDATPACVSNGDFQAGAVGWSSTGTAFKGWPHTQCNEPGGCYDGKGLYTADNGATTGTLRSNTFTITERYVCWQAAGHSGSATGVDLDVNGSIDLQVGIPGAQPNVWGEQCLDLQAYKGRKAQLVLMDNNSGVSNGWAAWDQVSCRTTPPTCVTNAGFQQPRLGWRRLGQAFAGWPDTWRTPHIQSSTDLAASSAMDPYFAAVTGSLHSSTFLIVQPYLCWQNAGYTHSYTGLDVDVDGTVDLRLDPVGRDAFGEQCLYVGNYAGRLAQVALVDPDNGAFPEWASWDAFSCRGPTLITHVGMCGNGTVNPGEECDDGNTVDTDACTNACRSARCGDFIKRNTETCDDGNSNNDDTCTNLCQPPRCGDSFVQAGEQCDDGNTFNGDACPSTCRFFQCGNGIAESITHEECDDGNTSNTDRCLTSCRLNMCGDGFVQAGVEECDDGNSVNTDACLNTCKTAKCGDNFVWEGQEDCEDGNLSSSDTCRGDCRFNVCGDGYLLQGKEECDDGNAGSNDLCTAECQHARCGDGYQQPGEQCDDGNLVDDDGCSPVCTSFCGGQHHDVCGGQCVNLENNNDHCGACGRACTGGRTCSRFGCQCPASMPNWNPNTGQCEAPASCGTGAAASGTDEPYQRTYTLPSTSGTLSLTYYTYTVQDRIKVLYQGVVMIDTGCVGAQGTLNKPYSGSSSQATVVVEPNCAGGSGTAWDFSLACAR